MTQVDEAQQDGLRKQALKPFEDGLADLRKRYLAMLDEAIAKTSAANQLDEALLWRAERQAFDHTQNVAADDSGASAGIHALRTNFRLQLQKLDQERLAKARTLLGGYDAVLEKNQTLLTERGRLDDALLLKSKREEIAIAWLSPSPLLAAAGAGTPDTAKPATAPTASNIKSALLGAATKEDPYVNSLGMKFVPVPINRGPTAGRRVLFCVWDTRVQDFDAFAHETKRDEPKPNFEQEPTHPVVNINLDDAKGFCAWLTEQERKAGKLGLNDVYRLPNDEEWSTAVGLPPEPGSSPGERSGKNNAEFPWGHGFPPKTNEGNYRDEAWHAKNPGGPQWLKGYTDGFVNTSPVGTYPPNRFGLFDMGGNVWQWCEDWYDASHQSGIGRGGSWDTHDLDFMVSSKRNRQATAQRDATHGFRCVLAVATH